MSQGSYEPSKLRCGRSLPRPGQPPAALDGQRRRTGLLRALVMGDRRCPQVRAALLLDGVDPDWRDYWRITAGLWLTTGRAPVACRQTSQPESGPARSGRSPAEPRPGAL